MLQCVPLGESCQLFTPYEKLLRRIHRQINNTTSQIGRRTVIVRQPDESPEDWDKFLEQLDIEESVRVTRMAHGSAQLQWTNQHRCLIASA